MEHYKPNQFSWHRNEFAGFIEPREKMRKPSDALQRKWTDHSTGEIEVAMKDEEKNVWVGNVKRCLLKICCYNFQ